MKIFALRSMLRFVTCTYYICPMSLYKCTASSHQCMFFAPKTAITFTRDPNLQHLIALLHFWHQYIQTRPSLAWLLPQYEGILCRNLSLTHQNYSPEFLYQRWCCSHMRNLFPSSVRLAVLLHSCLNRIKYGHNFISDNYISLIINLSWTRFLMVPCVKRLEYNQELFQSY